MANFNFEVDTREMAVAVHEIAPHVDGTTTAVFAMQAAVIAAEREATDAICHNVNRGFFTLIRSQISQKIAAVQSQLEARLLELRDQSQKLLTVKKSMERDFQMITSRYTKLFRSLDSALFNRVREVDLQTVDFVQKDSYRLHQRYARSQASLPVHQLETIRSSQIITASAAKAVTVEMIEGMHQFISDSMSQKRLTRSILSPGPNHESARIFLPVLVAEIDSSGSSHPQWRHYFAKSRFPGLTRAVEQAVGPVITSRAELFEWRPLNMAERRNVEEHFGRITTKAAVSERVKRRTMLLFATSAWLGTGKVQG